MNLRMENFLEILSNIYSIVVFAAIIVYPFVVQVERLRVEESNSIVKKEKWKRKLHALLVVLTIIATVLLLIFIFKKKYMWIFLPITVLTILEKTNEIYGSLTIIKNTISQKKGVEALSKRETDAIIMLALMMFNLYKIPQIIISYVMGLSKKIISDWLTIIILTMTVTLYCFLIGVLLLIPLKGIICLARYINQKIYLKKKLKKYIQILDINWFCENLLVLISLNGLLRRKK